MMLSESVLQFAGGNPTAPRRRWTPCAPGKSGRHDRHPREPRTAANGSPTGCSASSGAAPGIEWNADRPRARVEPRAGGVGRPLTSATRRPSSWPRPTASAPPSTAPDSAALDLVFTPDLQVLERQLRAALPALGDTPLAVAARSRVADSGCGPWARSSAWPPRCASSCPAPNRSCRRTSPAPTARRPAPSTSTSCWLGWAGWSVASAAAVASVAAAVAQIPDGDIVDTPELAATLARPAAALEPYGHPLEPDPERPLDLRWLRGAWQTAQARAAAGQAGLDAATTAAAAATPTHLVLDMVQDAVGAVFGDGFAVLPLLNPGRGPRRSRGRARRPGVGRSRRLPLRRFVADIGTVRPADAAASPTPGCWAARWVRTSGRSRWPSWRRGPRTARPPPAPPAGWPGPLGARGTVAGDTGGPRRPRPDRDRSRDRWPAWPSTPGSRTCPRRSDPKPTPTDPRPGGPAPDSRCEPTPPRPERRRRSCAPSPPTGSGGRPTRSPG